MTRDLFFLLLALVRSPSLSLGFLAAIRRVRGSELVNFGRLELRLLVSNCQLSTRDLCHLKLSPRHFSLEVVTLSLFWGDSRHRQGKHHLGSQKLYLNVSSHF